MTAWPTVEDCKPGMWAELTNGWVIGPIVETEFSGIYVKFSDGTWQLDVMGQHEVDETSSRLVKRVMKNPQ